MAERGWRRRCAAPLLLAGLVLVAGCARVPDSGPVHAGREIPPAPGIEDPDVQLLAAGPQDGESPTEVVNGFLVASATFDTGHAIARRFLTPAAAAKWQPDAQVVVYDPRAGFSVGLVGKPGVNTAKVVLKASQVATIDADGAWSPATTTDSFPRTFTLERVDGNWRIASPPDGLLLSRTDVTRSYRVVSTFFLDRTMQTVVPDQLFLPVNRPGLSTALVRALLHGPTKWLAPAVRTAVPAGTVLLGTAPVDNNTVTVNLSRQVLAADPDTRSALSAQLVWTLRQLPEVQNVRVLVEGSPLSVPGASGDVQQRDDWASFDPEVVTDDVPGYYRDASGRLVTTDGEQLGGPVGTGAFPLLDPAVSTSRDVVAGLRRTSTQALLYRGPLTQEPVRLASAADFTPPSFDRTGLLWTVATDASGDQRVLAAPRGGPPVTVPAPALAGHRVTSLRVSRDGTRVAVTVGTGSRARLLVGRVVGQGERVARLDGFRAIAPGLDAVRDVGWADARRVAVLAASGGEAASPWIVDIDGSSAVPSNFAGVTSFDALAAAPQRPLLVESNGQIYRGAGGRWSPLRPAGRDPVYPG